MLTITGSASTIDLPSEGIAITVTVAADGFHEFRQTRYETLPADELQRQIRSASLPNEELLRLAADGDKHWMESWLGEPDPFTSE